MTAPKPLTHSCFKNWPCELATKTTEQLYKVATHHAWMTTNVKKKKMDQQENYLLKFHKFVYSLLYSVRMGRPDILWFVNKFARAKRNGQKHVANAKHV